MEDPFMTFHCKFFYMHIANEYITIPKTRFMKIEVQVEFNNIQIIRKEGAKNPKERNFNLICSTKLKIKRNIQKLYHKTTPCHKKSAENQQHNKKQPKNQIYEAGKTIRREIKTEIKIFQKPRKQSDQKGGI